MIRSLQMSSDIAVRRLRNLSSVFLHARTPINLTRVLCSSSGKGDDQFVTIGDVSIKVPTPKNPHLVPTKYLGSVSDLSQSTLKHLRWIMQKDLLGQDVFLIGPPGPLRREVAMMYSELTKKEVEYVSLSRDTTETDLKQRREIKSGTAFYIDQSAVRAATEGRLLMLEGIEKAERNVLPVLNNLLENREMQLDDGRFLMAAERYDKLLKDHTQAELDAWKLVRVDENFRVIALGLPVPRYQGNPLDPPLRSRFQARDLNPLPFKEQMELLKSGVTSVETDRLAQMLSFANTLCTTEAHELGMPDFPLDNLNKLAQIQGSIPQVSSQKLLEMLYPHQAMLGKEGQTAVSDAFKSFGLLDQKQTASHVEEVRRSPEGAQVTLQVGSSRNTLQVSSGSVMSSGQSGFVSTPYHEELLADMMMSHSVHDFCIIGHRGDRYSKELQACVEIPDEKYWVCDISLEFFTTDICILASVEKGCGKTVLAKQFADLLGYHTETIMLYQDMSSRDLLQQRMTQANGDTTWRPSALVTAATEGSLAILDGIHRVNPGTFAVLHRLIHDRELMLFDGTRLLRADRYDSIKQELDISDEEMKERGVLRVHPSFRLLGLAEPPVLGSGNQQWLTPELLTMFLYHNMRPLTREEEIRLLNTQVTNMSKLEPLIALTHKLRLSHDTNLQSVATSLSTRQLLRVARRMTAYPQEELHSTVYKACLARFLPRLARSALDTELEQHSIMKTEHTKDMDALDKNYSCEVRDGRLRIGQTEVEVYQPDTLMKVPDVLFYENPQHMSVMEDMLKDYLLGEHLLLVGNQGVGKNKIVDRFLHLLSRPREYLQLHRDTTVQTLTLQPTVKEGVIVYEDSPLVRAVSNGYILVVDEADKAPTNVTCILKTLVESGEMHLSDGRRIVHADSGLQSSPSVLVCHPDFRMIVLANRPGFPFLGNDFFGAMGDIFSCHAVDNPDTESEIAMLKRYGPEVPDEILRRLVLTFSELRELADQGLISYPYSTREVVSMVKHLQKFPDEGLANVVRNVFDFDSYNKEVTETIVTTLHKHGIPIGADPRNVHLAKEFPLPPCQFRGEWQLQTRKTSALPVTHKQIRIKGPLLLPVQTFPLDRSEARSLLFSEQEAFWNIPLHETSVISDVAVTKGTMRQPGTLSSDIIHMATISPISLYSMDPKAASLSCIDLYDMFPTTRMSHFRPKLNIAPLGFPLDTRVIVHEELTNTVLEVNYEFGEVRRLDLSSLVEAATDSISRKFRAQQGTFRMCADFCHQSDGMVLFYKQEGDTIDIVHMLEGRCHSVSVPLKIQDIHMMSKHNWLLTECITHKKFVLSNSEENPFDYSLQEANDKSDLNMTSLDVCGGVPMHESHLSAVLGHKITSPNRMMADPYNYYVMGVGLPELSSVELHACPRKEHKDVDIPNRYKEYIKSPKGKLRTRDPVVYLPDSSQVVRALPDYQVPLSLFPEGERPKGLSGFLEVTNPVNKTVRYIPVPGATNTNIYHQWYTSASDINLVVAGMSNDGVVTVDTGGCVRMWETALMNLDKSMAQWRGLIGEGEAGRLQVTYDKDEIGKDVTSPKHGRVDPTGAPHVGGNQWAGGTGGRDTAGLGGVGGPYRLDAGHDVTQVPQAQKDQVPEEVRQAAREMGQKAFKERLRQIQMSEYDGDLYEQYSKNVRGQVKSLRVILDNLQAKGKERQWIKHQTYGDLDDAKLIEGLTGERSIYKRRGEKEPEPGTPQQKPKLIKLLCDVSGSMYRFNGHDGRLERQLEAMLMVMEAFESYEHKIKYDIVGHSGEGYKFDMVKQDKPPKNNKDRLEVIKTLHAHSQFCISGDSTLEAAKHAIKTITDQEGDEHFVIVLSDANLERYGIRPKSLADILNSNEDVNAYVIFIGSLGDQANRLLKQLPSGKAFICLDTKNLPNILQQIFTSSILGSS